MAAVVVRGGAMADQSVRFGDGWEGTEGGGTGGGLSVATMRTCLQGLALHSDTSSTPPAGRSPSAWLLMGVWEQDPSQGSEVSCMS